VAPVLRGWLAEVSEVLALGARRYALSPWNWIDVSMLGLLTMSLCLYWLDSAVGTGTSQTSYTCDAMVSHGRRRCMFASADSFWFDSRHLDTWVARKDNTHLVLPHSFTSGFGCAGGAAAVDPPALLCPRL